MVHAALLTQMSCFHCINLHSDLGCILCPTLPYLGWVSYFILSWVLPNVSQFCNELGVTLTDGCLISQSYLSIAIAIAYKGDANNINVDCLCR